MEDSFKAIAVLEVDGEIKWTYTKYESWEEVKIDTRTLQNEYADAGNLRIEAVSNTGRTIEVSVEENQVRARGTDQSKEGT